MADVMLVMEFAMMLGSSGMVHLSKRLAA
jgi:hypothetical protein